MEQLNQIKQYDEFKATLDKEFTKAAESFVRIGYLLKVARDTDILHNSGYKSVTEFAKAEYNITPDMVSRYIKINDRFSVDGYGKELREDMQGYGIAKLQIMLTLSDEVIEAIPKETTKSELQDIQREIKAEKEKTDIEVMLEDSNSQDGSPLAGFVREYFHEHPQAYEKAYENVTKAPVLDSMLDAVAPSGIAVLMARVPGTGRLMLSIKGTEQNMELINVRNNEKRTYEPICLVHAFVDCFSLQSSTSAKDSWQEVFSEEFPLKEKIAPVQPEMKPQQDLKEKYKNLKPEDVNLVIEKPEETEEKEEAAPESQPIVESTPEPVNTSEPECELYEEQPQGSRADQEEDITELGEEQPESLKHSQEDRNIVTLRWHDYSDTQSFSDKPKQNGEYIVTELTSKGERRVSIRYYDVINDLWGYRLGATKEENRVYGRVEAWMEKPEPWGLESWERGMYDEI